MAGRLSRRLSPTARLVETRLGPSASERGSLHERLDVLERYGSHLAEQGDRNTRETARASDALSATVLRVRDELRIELEHVRNELADRIEVVGDVVRSAPVPDAADLAFAAAALADLASGARVLVLGPADVAPGLASLGLDVSTVQSTGPVAGARLVHPEAITETEWDAVVELEVPSRSAEGAGLVAPGGLLVTKRDGVPEAFSVVREQAGRRCLARAET